MNQNKKLPKFCPSSVGVLRVETMHCAGCGTKIEGDFVLPELMRLSEENQQFVLDFVRCSGSLKEMAQKLGLSYPTVRNRLDEVISQLE